MQIDTKRFGVLNVDDDRLFTFPKGIVGFESLRQWVLLPDPESPAVAWLQSASSSDHALAVVSPRAFFPEFRVQVDRTQLASLKLQAEDRLYILTTLAGHIGKIETNLRAPLLLNLNRRLGVQVILGEDQPVRQPLPQGYRVRQLRMAA